LIKRDPPMGILSISKRIGDTYGVLVSNHGDDGESLFF
jgi:hypothetical protein